jgi:hypothetical protein
MEHGSTVFHSHFMDADVFSNGVFICLMTLERKAASDGTVEIVNA